MENLVTQHLTSLISFLFVLVGILLIGGIWVTLETLRVKKMSKIFFLGKNAGNLEHTMHALLARAKTTEENLHELTVFCQKIHAFSQKSLYKTGFVRFNPFKDVGGNQSFAVAFLDSHGNGIVLSTLYTREGSRIFAKPVNELKEVPGYTLTEEEYLAIHKAHSSKPIIAHTHKPKR